MFYYLCIFNLYYLYIPLTCNIFWTLIWLIPYLISFETFYLESPVSTSTSGIGSSFSIFTTFYCMFQLSRTSCLRWISSMSRRPSTSKWPLTFSLAFPSQIFFFLQGKLVCIFYITWGQEIHLILDLKSHPIDISGHPFWVILHIPYSNIDLIKFLSMLFDSHLLLL